MNNEDDGRDIFATDALERTLYILVARLYEQEWKLIITQGGRIKRTERVAI